jgi:type III secretion system YscQ/HrcQ family protein
VTALKPRVRPFPYAELPRLARGQVEAGRTLLRHLPLTPGPDWAEVCRALGGPVDITLVEAYAVPGRELGAQARGTVIVLGLAGGRRALLAIDPRLAPRLARRALGTDAQSEELPAPRALTTAEEGAIEMLVGALVDGGTAQVRVEGVAQEGELVRLGLSGGPEAWLWVVAARVSTPVGSGWARLVAPDSLRLAAPPAPAAALFAHRARLADARVTLWLELARVPLEAKELAGLAVGDVVLLGRPAAGPRLGAVALRLGRGGFRGRLDGEALTIDAPFSATLVSVEGAAPAMDEQDPQKPASANAPLEDGALISELPVEVTAELGRVTMTGRELLELRPGAVILVGRPLAGPVDLTVGGRVVARGELVDVEGEIGVRVTQLND